ncbi:GPI-anchored surface protein, putative [Bodo saltans]|uniref:GPI-anchored surface protein, putative n=1 Tax=Bodo saltans TaxID=75058 RepID=A0A0S4IU00_BODSA|nr:GPI-anchored surface protein, putative [Bodo saltans]|eukprot:CUE81893.1 GPI-anchored surface protein, putative [Bodo saltans]
MRPSQQTKNSSHHRGGQEIVQAAAGAQPSLPLAPVASVAVGHQILPPPRRQSGVAFLARQRATPVRLGNHPTLDALVPDGGLRSAEVVLLCCSSSATMGTSSVGSYHHNNMANVANCGHSSTTELAYHIASEHAAVAGGRVIWISAPGGRSGGGLRSRRFVMHLEEAARRVVDAAANDVGTSSLVKSNDDDDHESYVSAVHNIVHRAASLVEHSSCGDVDEFLATLYALQPSGDVDDDDKPEERANNKRSRDDGNTAANISTVTPLLVIDGLGATQYLSLYERVLGQGEVPLKQALQHAVLKLHCAVVLTDMGYPSATATQQQQQQKQQLPRSSYPATTVTAVNAVPIPMDDPAVTAAQSCYSYRSLLSAAAVTSLSMVKTNHRMAAVYAQDSSYRTSLSNNAGGNNVLTLKAVYSLENFHKPRSNQTRPDNRNNNNENSSSSSSSAVVCSSVLLDEYVTVALLVPPVSMVASTRTTSGNIPSQSGGGSSMTLHRKATVAFLVDTATCVTAA